MFYPLKRMHRAFRTNATVLPRLHDSLRLRMAVIHRYFREYYTNEATTVKRSFNIKRKRCTIAVRFNYDYYSRIRRMSSEG